MITPLSWLSVLGLNKEEYCSKWEGWAHKPVNHISWVASVTQHFGGVLCCHFAF